MKKPEFLGPANAAAFDDADVAGAYRHRVPYPPATFDLLVQLTDPGCRVVLDVGCGEGALARPLAMRVDRVDAVDPSAPILDAGRRASGGDHPSIRWILGRAEDVGLEGPYGLVCAGASLHWMEWEVVMPRFVSGREVLAGPEFVQPVDDWIESLHSHGRLARARLGPVATRAFDDAARDLAARDGGVVRREARTFVEWGRPRSRLASLP